MSEQILITAITILGTAVASVWASYLMLQASKDKAIKEERDRADTLAQKALERSDLLLAQQRDRFHEQIVRLEREHKELLSITISQYEKMFRVLKSQHGIDKELLVEETKRTQKIDNLSESQIAEISSDMKLLLEDDQNGGH